MVLKAADMNGLLNCVQGPHLLEPWKTPLPTGTCYYMPRFIYSLVLKRLQKLDTINIT